MPHLIGILDGLSVSGTCKSTPPGKMGRFSGHSLGLQTEWDKQDFALLSLDSIYFTPSVY